MRIGLDAHHLNGKPQGSRTYLLNLIRELARLARDDELFVYSFDPDATRRMLEQRGLLHRRIFPSSARFRLPFVVPALELRDRIQVFHSQYICPLLSPAREVVSIHDILFESHPHLFEGAFSRTSVWLIRRSARRARFVLTVSEFSRNMLLERYGLAEDRVLVTPDAVDPQRFRPLSLEDSEEALARTRRRYGIDRPFLLHVGRLEPRKNLERLVRAFGRVRERSGGNVVLGLVGPDDFRYKGIYDEIARMPDGAVRRWGIVPDDDLPALYNLASCLVYPSLCEGFGMPVLEAMACGTPVVASPRGALTEVGQDAALWIDPEDEDSLVAAIEKVLEDGALARELRRRGLERAAHFRWTETARRTLDAYRRCVEE